MKMRLQGLAMVAALTGIGSLVPVAASADAPAVAAPTIPAPFIGAPTNYGANGQFSVNFDDQGRYLGTGTAPEHFDNFALTPERATKQAQSQGRRASRDTRTSSALFTSFQRRLHDLAAPEAAMAGSAR